MININSSRAFKNLTFKQGLTQMEKVKCALEQIGPLSDRELSEITEIPRHLIPARRGELVKLGVVRKLKDSYDTITKQTVDVWATTAYTDRLQSLRAAEAVRVVMQKAERQVVKIFERSHVQDALFVMLFVILFNSSVEAVEMKKKVVIRTPYAKVTSTPTQTPTPTPKKAYSAPIFTPEKSEIKELVCKYFGGFCYVATAVFIPESGLSCSAVGDNHLVCTGELMGDGRTLKEHCIADGVEYGRSYGVAQIRYLPGRPTPDELLDCNINLKYAHGMWRAQGFSPWSAFTNKSYLKYL
jgi:hypothetical protein